ncbi:hypothetical protein Val02_12360 [Virgisporangium aliadipatigenens]|uniref:F5/8 type C domain-containing protein n=1 Tax=Virgisporangium aliadipatigenens TaxID=741659 RepID=A0A8J4DN06_9ACTN|nr:discoidin domain-containing protein [Virgisporangium aliadipatigenens]GIJ44350.1 hypothetical protein Val02_12360 [Virgisporangium aliadipatigenens]
MAETPALQQVGTPALPEQKKRAKGWPGPIAGAMVTGLCAVLGIAAFASGTADLGQTGKPDDHDRHTPQLVPAAVKQAAPLPRGGWTVSADSQEPTTNNQASKMLDGDANTFWHTQFVNGTPPLPHEFTLDMKAAKRISGVTVLPRPKTADAGSVNGRIGQYKVLVSTDGANFTLVASGTFVDDPTLKTVTFATTTARYVRLTALTEAADRGQWSSVAEFNVLDGTDPLLHRQGWTASADSQETAPGADNPASKALDGNTATYWHSKFVNGTDGLPHQITIDTHGTYLISGLSYLPRPTTADPGSANGRIGAYRIESSVDGAVWTVVANGAFPDSPLAQTVTFDQQLARYVRLVATGEAANRGPWSSAAELNLHGRAASALSRDGWTVTADSEEPVDFNEAWRMLDSSAATYWHTQFVSATPALPHSFTLDTKGNTAMGGLTLLTRPGTGSPNGRIGQYRIDVSGDNATWTQVATGTFTDTAGQKSVVFPNTTARYVRLTALTEAGNRGQWSSAAEVGLIAPLAPADPSKTGAWGAPIGLPVIPVAVVPLPNGKVLAWSSGTPDTFPSLGKTYTAIVDPNTRVVTPQIVNQTGHDMFCPGISIIPDGRVVITGGDDTRKTTIYDPASNAWTTGPLMVKERGYQSTTTLSDGRVFNIGGSWSGPIGGKNGEVWSPSTGWTDLPGAAVGPMLTADPQGVYRSDNHAWLFGWSNGTVLQAGPSKAMNWYGTTGTGSTWPAGQRGTDNDAMNGNAVMYDTGKILTLGGSPAYQESAASARAHVLTIASGGGAVNVREVAPMANARSFANSVVLPDGKVAVFGGQTWPVPFSDNTAVYDAEIWDPATETFTPLAPSSAPRTYHSVAVLLPDARVFTGGGGLCGPGCANNHWDGEIFTPPYLLNADGSPRPRPTITGAPTSAPHGAGILVATDRPVSKFALVRYGSATHSVNTDQRRISLTATEGPNGYNVTIPADPGVALPGTYMLFAMDANGVPSVARTIRIG